MTDFERRASDLDERFLAIVRDFAAGGAGCDDAAFDALACALCAYQLATNPPYAAYAALLGATEATPPTAWRAIPPVPAAAFKDATLATFPVRHAELTFRTSGTTTRETGSHYFERAALYDASFLAAFDRYVIPGRPKLRYLNVVPNPRLKPHSSLGYMMGAISVLRGDGKAGWFLGEDAPDGSPSLDVDGFVAAMRASVRDAQPICLAGTAFGLVALLDALDVRDLAFAAPAGSRAMETGGFKGRTRVVARDELYARIERSFGIPPSAIVAEYGMTELASQYYDAPAARGNASEEPRIKVAPPWLRTRVVDAGGRDVAPGETGDLVHVDLGNRSSVVAIRTEDRGYAAGAGIVLLGRETDAAPRGCSLDAEDLRAR